MTDNPTLSERENGPLVVKGLTSMQDSAGQEIKCKLVMALCRCGQSKNKPFCDGSHKDAGFQSRGGKPAGRDRLITYTGTQVSVTYNPMLCSHAAECGRLASHMFNPAQKPWVQPNKGTVEEVRAVIAACPSGALALVGSAGSEHLVAARAQVVVEKNGPYWVQDIDAPTDPQGEAMSPRKYVLCRCGKSGNKPYCDGTHRDVGWEDGS